MIVTHRLASARLADRILVMEKGRIAEAGTHEELLAAGGLYSRMWKAQAENYVVLTDGGRYYEADFLTCSIRYFTTRPGESAAYLAAEIMSCLISFLQLNFAAERGGQRFYRTAWAVESGKAFCSWEFTFLFQVLIQNGKERLQFGLE